MDEVTKEAQNEIPLSMIFAHDIILVEKNLEEVNHKLDKWRLVHEGKRLTISRNKTEFIEYAFGG